MGLEDCGTEWSSIEVVVCKMNSFTQALYDISMLLCYCHTLFWADIYNL